MSTSLSSSPISNMGLYHNSDQHKSLPSPEGLGTHAAIIRASSTHSTICSQARHRPMSDHISIWDQREQPRVFGIKLTLKTLPGHVPCGPASLGHCSECVWPSRLLTPHEPARFVWRPTPQDRNIHPQYQSTHPGKGQIANRVASGW